MNVSVIIPVYNAEKYIEKAIQSCLDLEEVKEIIVVDDGYKDNAYSIVENWTKKEPKIRLFTHPNHENQGAGPSRNLGIEKATQEWIAFLDADDFYLPNRFKKDKMLAEQHQEADGFYNAIGTYFYTDKAKEEYKNSKLPELTTVDSSIQNQPNVIFEYVIGIIPNAGYFHLDGLTVKKESLLTNHILFMESSMHEDTQLIVRLAYATQLLPSEITQAVAMRGVHEENRITANNKYELTKFENRYKMWDSLQEWTYKTNIEKRYKDFIATQRNYTLARKEPNKNVTTYFKNVVGRNLLHHPNYLTLHKEYLGKNPFGNILLKLRNFAVKFS